MEVISTTLPIEGIYADISASPNSIINQAQKTQADDILLEKFHQILDLLNNNADKQKILAVCQQTNIFNGYEKQLTKWIDEYVK